MALGACTPRAPLVLSAAPPRGFVLSAADTSTGLRLDGEVGGPLLGVGERAQLTAWVRADGWIRADLHYEVEGRAADDVLVWTPEAAFILDGRTGRLTLLGDEPGALEADEGAFFVRHALWLVLGRQPCGGGGPTWERRHGEWRGRMGKMAARGRTSRDGATLTWTELAWLGDGGRVHSLSAELRRPTATPWGRVPAELSLDGAGLPGRAVVRWRVQSIPAPGDTLFDPLWRP